MLLPRAVWSETISAPDLPVQEGECKFALVSGTRRSDVAFLCLPHLKRIYVISIIYPRAGRLGNDVALGTVFLGVVLFSVAAEYNIGKTRLGTSM